MPSISVSESVSVTESVLGSLLASSTLSTAPLGRIIFDGITFTTDPDTYEPLNWDKRVSVHQLIGGGVVIQDFGLFAKDNIIRLASGQQGLIETNIAAGLHQRYGQRGRTFTLRDWMSNEFTVAMLRFRTWPNIVGPYHFYEMECKITSIVKIYGETYAGS